jgi:riboflavin synthase
MFTGIVEEMGRIRQIQKGAHSAVLHIQAKTILDDLHIGDSVAVNGICLTVTTLPGDGFTADVMHETLNRTSLASLGVGSYVNLERAMQAGGRFGGHIVSGHIDGTGQIQSVQRDDNALWYTIAAGPEILKYVVEKGSITIDGISLTVARVSGDSFAVSLIPHTAAVTVLGLKKAGDRVNLEADILGKYVEKLLQPAPEPTKKQTSSITMDFLQQHGY